MAQSQTQTDDAQDEITTGIETDTNRIEANDHDVEAYADDGEHATVWDLTRVSDTEVEGVAYRCKAGLRERVPHGNPTVHTVDADKSTEEFGREYANADPRLAVDLAREHFNDDD